VNVDGYFIVQTFERRYADYDRPAPADQHAYSIPTRLHLPSFSGKRYRGVDRRPLTAVPRELRQGFQQAVVEPEAQDRLNRLEERGLAQNDLIRDLPSAQWVIGAVRDRGSYELIAVTRFRGEAEPTTTSVLGWDVAYFDGDHYSAIANCMFFPSWAGTDEAGITYAAAFERLNPHGLFSSISDAREFGELYDSVTGTSDRSLEYLLIMLPAA